MLLLLVGHLLSLIVATAVNYIDENGPQSHSAILIDSATTLIGPGWYYVSPSPNVIIHSHVEIVGDVYLILEDDCSLAISFGMRAQSSGSLTIYGQIHNSGKLSISANGNSISGNGRLDVNIKGGTIWANSPSGCAGIGGCSGGNSGTITISGGNFTAVGGKGGAGIGGGQDGSTGTIIITGGIVTAIGGEGGAGIGGGKQGDGGTITISGGAITAKGGDLAAGIGGGVGGDGGTVIITGGSVKAVKGSGGGDAEDIGRGSTGADSGTLRDSSNVNVYLNTLDFSPSVGTNTSIAAASIGGVASYGLNDVVTDSTGKLYFYLPASSHVEKMELTVDIWNYVGNYTRLTAHSNTETLVLRCPDRTPIGSEWPCGWNNEVPLCYANTGRDTADTAQTVCTEACDGTFYFGNTDTGICELQACASRHAVPAADKWPCGWINEIPLCYASTGSDTTDAARTVCTKACDGTFYFENTNTGICDLQTCTSRHAVTAAGAAAYPCGTSTEECYQDLGSGNDSRCIAKQCTNDSFWAVDAATRRCKLRECRTRTANLSSTDFPCGSDCVLLYNNRCSAVCSVSDEEYFALSGGVCVRIECQFRHPRDDPFICGESCVYDSVSRQCVDGVVAKDCSANVRNNRFWMIVCVALSIVIFVVLVANLICCVCCPQKENKKVEVCDSGFGVLREMTLSNECSEKKDFDAFPNVVSVDFGLGHPEETSYTTSVVPNPVHHTTAPTKKKGKKEKEKERKSPAPAPARIPPKKNENEKEKEKEKLKPVRSSPSPIAQKPKKKKKTPPRNPQKKATAPTAKGKTASALKSAAEKEPSPVKTEDDDDDESEPKEASTEAEETNTEPEETTTEPEETTTEAEETNTEPMETSTESEESTEPAETSTEPEEEEEEEEEESVPPSTTESSHSSLSSVKSTHFVPPPDEKWHCWDKVRELDDGDYDERRDGVRL